MNLLRALVTVSGMTLLSRILGFVRDFVIARTFGAGLATDAFFVAFKLPNLLRRMFAEGAFSQAFVPILGEYKNKRGDQETLLLIDHVTSILSLALFAVTAIGVAAAPLLVWISAPGFAADADKFELTVDADPHHLSLHFLHVAGRARRRHSQHLEPLCAARLHAGAAQRLLHRHGAVRRTVFRPAGPRAGLGGLPRRRPAAGDPDSRLRRIAMLPRLR